MSISPLAGTGADAAVVRPSDTSDQAVATLSPGSSDDPTLVAAASPAPTVATVATLPPSATAASATPTVLDSGGDPTSVPPGTTVGPPNPTPAPPNPTSKPTPTPAPTPAPGQKTVTVGSVPALLSALADNSVDVIVVRNGTYHVSPSNAVKSDSLWIGHRFASRTRPILVRAETRGGVTFDGGGGTDYGGLSFEDGAHDQTWDGFNFANMSANETGIVEVGGYVPRATPHHITMRFISILGTCRGSAVSAEAPTVDHAFYISNAASVGPHDLRFEDISVDGRGGLASAFHFDHGDSTNPNATKVTVTRLSVLGTQQAIILWLPPVKNITFDTVQITDALSHAIRYESVGGSGIVFSHITSTGTGGQPFYSSLGSSPPGVTFSDVSLH